MKKTKNIKFSDLIPTANLIKQLYWRAYFRLKFGEEEDEKVIFTLSEKPKKYEMSPVQIMEIINEAIETLEPLCQKIIKIELLQIESAPPYWYLSCVSRSTYYRYRKEAYVKFISYFK